MAHTKRALPKRLPLGDAAVDGLLSGIAAGLLMGLYLVVAGMLAGNSPAVTLSSFDARLAASPVTGMLVHLAVAGVYGAVFGALASELSRRWHLRAPRAWLAGLVYGLALLLLAETAIVPATPALARIATGHFVLAHLLYGLALGYLFDRGVNV